MSLACLIRYSTGAHRRLGQALIRQYRRMTTYSALAYERSGEPSDVLQISHNETRHPLPESHVELEFLLAPINPSDINTVQGKYPIQPRLPAVGGHEGVAKVTAVGSKVSGIHVGDHVVMLEPGQGTWRQRAILPASVLLAVPSALTLEAAATLCINPPTAMLMLEEFVELKEGDVVVQNGATSAVGRAVIQLAKVKGLRTVNVIRARPDQAAWVTTEDELKRLGATVVTTEDKIKQSIADIGLPAPKLALNCVGGSAALAVAKVLDTGGVHVTYGGMSMKPVEIPTSLLIFKDISFHGFWLSGRSAHKRGVEGHRSLLLRAAQHIMDGHLEVAPTKAFPLSKYKDAFAAAQGSFKDAKVLLDLQAQ